MGTEEVGHIIEEPFGAIGKKRKRVKDSTVNPALDSLPKAVWNLIGFIFYAKHLIFFTCLTLEPINPLTRRA
jgi:hypothetical protein